MRRDGIGNEETRRDGRRPDGGRRDGGRRETRQARHDSRIADLRAVLSQAEAALPILPPTLVPLVAPRLLTRLHGLRSTVSALADADPCTAETRNQLLAVAAPIDELAGEIIDLAAGGLLRVHGPYGGTCRVADRFIAEVLNVVPTAGWRTFCVPGSADRTSRLDRVIRLGVGTPPGADAVWTLPFVAHELGHLVGPTVVTEAGSTVRHDVN